MRSKLLGLVFLVATVPAAGNPPMGVPFVPQEKNGCGAASVAMVMQYWNALHPELELAAADPAKVYRDLYRTELRAIPLAAMSGFLKDHGYAAFTFRGGMPDLESQTRKGRPVIVAMRGGSNANIHFAVVAGLDEDWVWLNDPTKRKARKMKRAKFEQVWRHADGWLLLAAPARPE